MGKVFEVIYMLNKSVFFFTSMYDMIRYFGQKQRIMVVSPQCPVRPESFCPDPETIHLEYKVVLPGKYEVVSPGLESICPI